MKRLRLLAYVILIPLAVIAVASRAGERAIGEDMERQPSLLEKLRSPRAEEVDEAKATLLAEQKDLTRGLIAIVSDPELRQTNRHAVLSAIELLGELRAPEAAEPLCDLLLYGWKGDISDPTRFPMKFPLPDEAAPAVPALTKIGIPALKPVTEKLIAIQEDTADWGSLQLHCLWVIKDILGPRLGKAYIAHLLESDQRAARSQIVKDGLRFMDLQIMATGEGTEP